ncbi:MAG: hypothetical protein BWY76_00945 [bacterium ADurb.Bin429]|nr:MAG: hypothetical protein BWY76_00945 [bacterium ADurb.Bin429]
MDGLSIKHRRGDRQRCHERMVMRALIPVEARHVGIQRARGARIGQRARVRLAGQADHLAVVHRRVPVGFRRRPGCHPAVFLKAAMHLHGMELLFEVGDAERRKGGAVLRHFHAATAGGVPGVVGIHHQLIVAVARHVGAVAHDAQRRPLAEFYHSGGGGNRRFQLVAYDRMQFLASRTDDPGIAGAFRRHMKVDGGAGVLQQRHLGVRLILVPIGKPAEQAAAGASSGDTVLNGPGAGTLLCVWRGEDVIQRDPVAHLHVVEVDYAVAAHRFGGVVRDPARLLVSGDIHGGGGVIQLGAFRTEHAVGIEADAAFRHAGIGRFQQQFAVYQYLRLLPAQIDPHPVPLSRGEAARSGRQRARRAVNHGDQLRPRTGDIPLRRLPAEEEIVPIILIAGDQPHRALVFRLHRSFHEVTVPGRVDGVGLRHHPGRPHAAIHKPETIGDELRIRLAGAWINKIAVLPGIDDAVGIGGIGERFVLAVKTHLPDLILARTGDGLQQRAFRPHEVIAERAPFHRAVTRFLHREFRSVGAEGDAVAGERRRRGEEQSVVLQQRYHAFTPLEREVIGILRCGRAQRGGGDGQYLPVRDTQPACLPFFELQLVAAGRGCFHVKQQRSAGRRRRCPLDVIPRVQRFAAQRVRQVENLHRRVRAQQQPHRAKPHHHPAHYITPFHPMIHHSNRSGCWLTRSAASLERDAWPQGLAGGTSVPGSLTM